MTASAEQHQAPRRLGLHSLQPSSPSAQRAAGTLPSHRLPPGPGPPGGLTETSAVGAPGQGTAGPPSAPAGPARPDPRPAPRDGATLEPAGRRPRPPRPRAAPTAAPAGSGPAPPGGEGAGTAAGLPRPRLPVPSPPPGAPRYRAELTGERPAPPPNSRPRGPGAAGSDDGSYRAPAPRSPRLASCCRVRPAPGPARSHPHRPVSASPPLELWAGRFGGDCAFPRGGGCA
ncbi:skin secretory protein xP2-like [Phaenicophaeus curvirostris]|uniref:skin secretory protein xP2-like n=1 Tax=Phaenicophaeus curvirostris TaxID=33595 RepID=UPI0037F0F2AB